MGRLGWSRAVRGADTGTQPVSRAARSTRTRSHSLAFRALGCQVAARVLTGGARTASERLASIRAELEAAEAALSRFRPDSELSRLNRATGRPVAVSRLLWALLERALEAARQSGGLYDPTVIDALEAAGYDRPFDRRLSSEAPPRPLAARADWSCIALDRERQTVQLPPGVRLDLAGYAKAWLAERAADRLAELGPCYVDAGGDLAVRGAPPGQPGWPIAVADPRRPERDLALLLVADAGLATSGIDYRTWRRAGLPQHHIIDPRTRRPAATDLLSVTVVAGDLSTANRHSLTAMILGLEAGRDYLSGQDGVEALLVRTDGARSATAGFERYVYTWHESAIDA